MYNDENSKVIQVDIENEMKKSFLEYSMSVIVARALPDVRDGLKPVHRRIIYTMNDAGNTAEKPYPRTSHNNAACGEIRPLDMFHKAFGGNFRVFYHGSDKEHAVRIVVELKKDAVPQIVLNKLYAYTDLQTTVGVNISVTMIHCRPFISSISARARRVIFPFPVAYAARIPARPIIMPPVAAYRYTEARMAKMSGEMLADIGKDTIPYQSNYLSG